MKVLLASTALAALVAGPLLAQTATTTDSEMFMQSVPADDIRASDFIGHNLYAAPGEVAMTPIADAPDDWQDLGSINDVLMTADGKVDAVLIDVGGFLGIGSKTVALTMASVKIVPDSDATGEFFLASTLSKDTLNAAPEFTMPGEQAANTTTTAPAVTPAPSVTGTGDNTAAAGSSTVAPADGTMGNTATSATAGTAAAGGAVAGGAASMADGTATAPADPNAGYSEVSAADLTSEEMKGAAVYDSDNQWIGEVGNLVLAEDGKVSKAVIDVGGFLGIGEKPVALDMQDLTLMRKPDGGDLRVKVSSSEADLKAMPEYKN